MPQIRKITRVGFLAIQLTFLNSLYSALVQLIQPSIGDPAIENSSRTAAIIMLIFVLILMSSIIYHFYHTYNSDVLEHYYTLR